MKKFKAIVIIIAAALTAETVPVAYASEAAEVVNADDLDEISLSDTIPDEEVIEDDNPYQTNQIIVFDDTVDVSGASNAYYNSAIDAIILEYDTDEDTKAAYETLAQTNDVIVNAVVCAESIGTITDNADKYQALGAYGTDFLSEYTTDSVTVAVIDSGYEYYNAEIPSEKAYFNNRIVSGYNAVDENDDVSDLTLNKHGTVVAGLIADSTPENVKIMPVRILNSSGRGSTATLLAAYKWAVDNGADIINMSLGWELSTATSSNTDAIGRLISEAKDKGIVSIAAAGNHAKNLNEEAYYPASYDDTIAVSAVTTDDAGNISFADSYSDYGDAVDFTAPGTHIASSIGDNTTYYKGTSFSAAFVSGEFACLMLAYPDKSPDEYIQLASSYAVDLGDEGKDVYYGDGIINLDSLEKNVKDEDQADAKIGPVNENGIWVLYDENENKLVGSGTPNVSGKKYYLENGILRSGWLLLGDWQMYFDPQTYEAAIGVTNIDGTVYLFDENGIRITANGTPVISGKKYYFEDGMIKSGWLKLANWQMYFDPQTYEAAIGITSIDGKAYMFDENGVEILNSRTEVINGSKYWFQPDGSLMSGWVTLGVWRMYFDPHTYKAATGTVTIGGKTYTFNSDGVLM